MEAWREVSRARRDLLTRESKLVAEMQRLYLRSEKLLQARLLDLRKEVVSVRPGEDIGLFFRRERVITLLSQIEGEIRGLGPQAGGIVSAAQSAGIVAGVEVAEKLTRGLVTAWNRLPTMQLETLAGYMADGTPLGARLAKEGAEAAVRAKEVLFDGLLNGRGARQIGRELHQAVSTVTRYNATVIARTESLRAYRTATIDSYALNSEVVSAWRWISSKDKRTCAACIALDGTIHPLTESFGSHPACRCQAVPELIGRAMDYGQTGREWFAEQPESVQRRILGPAKHRLYAAGKIDLPDLVDRHPSVWGPTGNVKSLRQLAAEGKISQEDRIGALKRAA
jgi:SPP1 gp7 family putative phage head morphogenesis protein